MSKSLKQRKTKYFGRLLHSRNIRDEIYSLKCNKSFSELCELTKNINSDTNISFRYIFGNPLPKNYTVLGQLEGVRYIPAADDLQSEINWVILSIRKFRSEINLFLKYKKQYENAFIVGNYDKASLFLAKIEAEISTSNWSLENRMTLLEFSKSPEDNKLFLSEFIKKNRGFFSPTLSHYLSNKSEKNLSILKYNADINAVLANLRSSSAEANRQYYYFKLNKFEFFGYTEYCNILSFDSHNSVIDRYLCLIDILKIVLSDQKTDKNLKDFCLSRVKYLLGKIQDESLVSLHILNEPDSLKNYTDEEFDLETIDMYTSGDYSNCIVKLGRLIIDFPSKFEYYLLYVKSYLFSGLEFKFPTEIDSIQNTILKDMYFVLGKITDPSSSLTSLNRLMKNLSSFKLAEGLFFFLNLESLQRRFWEQYNFLAFSHENPLIAKHYNSPEIAEKYFLRLLERKPNSITLNYALFRLLNQSDLIENLGLPKTTSVFEIAKIKHKEGNYIEEAKCWKDLILMSQNILPIFEVAIINLFQCFINLGKFDEAISLYVDSYIVNQFIVKKIDCTPVYIFNRRNKFRYVQPTIDLPLFYTLSKADENEIHIAYEKFNSNLGVEKPSNLFKNESGIDQQKLILFYKYTCVTEIFKHSIFINGSKEGYSERISVCHHLILIDSENEALYKYELDSLTDILIIQEGLQQLDESKIYVYEQGLINTELKEFEGLFERYKTIANLSKDESKQLVFFVQNGVLALMDKNHDVSDESKKTITSHPLKDVFKEIFDIISEKFLNSKFGISAYLSTRIRHGVLLGEIRPIFEKYNLISQRDESNNYKEVFYWNSRYRNISMLHLEILQKSIADFSEKVDNVIFDLLKQKLQIKFQGDNNGGWFDYTFSDKELVIFSLALRDTKDYSEFVKKAIAILWEKTDKNLEFIRCQIQIDVKKIINDALNHLESDIRLRLGFIDIPEVYTNITTCSTEVQNVIDRIASWFNRSGSQTSNFTLDKVINIVLENVNHSYQSKRIELEKRIKSNIIIKGEYYSHFADLLRIFLDNILKHSEADVYSIPAVIEIYEENEWINIYIVNDYSVIVGNRTVPDMGEIRIESQRLSTEGKSGLYKAKKILQYDLKDDMNFCKLSVSDDNKFSVNLKIRIKDLLV
jgi:hypothetical protein